MVKKILCLTGCSLLFSLSVYSQQQDWVSMMRNPGANVHDVQKAFYQWDAKQEDNKKAITSANNGEEEEGSQTLFKRWEWMMYERTYPSGNRPDAAKIATEYHNFLRAQSAHKGIPHSTQSTANWTYVGNTSVPPNIPSDGNMGGDGRVSRLRFYPGNNNIMFACCPTGGLWKTTNGGTSWSTNTDQLGDIAISDIAINPLNNNIMYLATGDDDGINSVYPTVSTIGVLKSSDGGNTWSATGLSYTLSSTGPSRGTINIILINPSDTSIVVAATSFGIYYTSNSGVSWTKSTSGDFMSMEFEPSHPSRVYASTYNGTFYTSSDGGQTFTHITSGLPTIGVGRMALAVSAADTNDVYLLATDNSYYAFYGLYLSTNHGTSFSAVSTLSGGAPNILGRSATGNDPTVGQGWYDLAIAVSPTNIDSVVVGGINIWLSGDGGSTWSLNAEWTGSGAPYVHADVHSLIFVPGHSSSYVATCDGGVFETKNYGSSWTDLSNNLEIAQQYSMGPSAKTAGRFITGWQDNGTNLCSGGSWTQNVGGDGMVCFIDYSTDANCYAENPEGAFVCSTDNGANWTSVTSGISETGPWVTKWMQDPQSPNTLYAGFNNVWKSTNQGTSWSQVSTWSSSSITALAIDSSNNNYIYAAQAGKLEYTSNGGTSWTDITGTLPVGSAGISAIAVNPKNLSHIWVTFSGYSSGNKVYQSYNTGATWTNLSTGLPNLPVNCIAYQPGTLEALYIGTDQGVYYHDTINGWVSYNTGLPNVMVGDVKVAMVNKTLLAATYGRGSWQTNLFGIAAGSAPAAYFKALPTTICAGSSVQFTDTSTNSPTSWAWTFTGGTPSTSTSQNPNVTYNTAGTYAVKLKVSNSNGSDSITKTAYITVNSVPVVTINPPSSSLCMGNSVSLTASGATSYTWSPVTGLNATTGAAVIATPTTSTTYTVIGTSSGCSSTQSVVITVNGTPTVNITPASAAVCSGVGANLTASGATSYSWSPATGLSATTGASVTATPTATVTYTVTGTTGTCTNTDTVTVTVSATPTVTVTPPSASICSGNNVSLTASGATTYLWSPATGLSASTGANVTATPVTTTTYTITGTTGGCNDTALTVITVTPTPTLTVSPSSATICSGTGITIIAGGATNYSWSPATGLSATTGDSVIATPLTATTYTVTGTNGVCTSIDSSVITTGTTPTVTVIPSSDSICSGNSVALTAGGATNYTWSPATGLSTTTGANVTATPANTITYTITGLNGTCSDTASAIITVTPTPTLTLSPASAAVCSGVGANIVAGGATTYTWSPASGLSATTGTNVTATPTVTTTYTVTGYNGSCTSTKTITVSIGTTPTVTVTPPSDSVCSGTKVTLTASGATSYSWSPAAGLNTSTGSSVMASPTVTTTYTVIGTTGGCGDTESVHLGITPAVNVTPAVASICTGDTGVTLTAGGSAGYTWSPSTGLSATTGSPVLATPGATTTYTITGTTGACVSTQKVTVTVNSTHPVVKVNPPVGIMCTGGLTNLAANGASVYTWSPSTGLSATTGAVVRATPSSSVTYTVTGITNGCSDTQSVSVTVNPTPTVTVTPPSDTLCFGSSVNLAASGASTYTWSPVSGLNTASGANVNAKPTATTKYVVTGTLTGCKDTQSVMIWITPLPTVTLTPVSATICSGNSVTLTASGATSYSWAPPSGLNVDSGAVVTDTGIVTTTFTVTGTANNCSNKKTVKVTVVTTPTLSVTPAAVTICNGSKTTLKVSGATSYLWTPSTGLSSSISSTVTASPTVATSYTVTGTNGSGCNDADSVSVNVIPAVTPVITGNDTICKGDVTTLTASGGTSYKWSNSDTNAIISINPSVSTTYSVTVSNGYCSTTTKTTVVVKALTVPAISKTGDTLKCKPTGLPAYQWYLNDTAISGSTYDTLIMSRVGKYKVEVTNSNGCSDTNIIVVTTLVGMNQFSLNQFIALYPNPSTGLVQLDCTIPNGEYVITLTDVLGQVVYAAKINVTGNYHGYIDMTNYAQGLYIFNLKGSHSSAEKKILISH